MHSDHDLALAFAHYRREGLVVSYLGALRPGKEAHIHCCRRVDGGYAILKLYTDVAQRGFRRDADYCLGTGHLRSRARRAVLARTSFGIRIDPEPWAEAVWRQWWEGELEV